MTESLSPAPRHAQEIKLRKGLPKPAWLVDRGLNLGLSREEMYQMTYNEFLERLSLVIEGQFRVLPPNELPSPKSE